MNIMYLRYFLSDKDKECISIDLLNNEVLNIKNLSTLSSENPYLYRWGMNDDQQFYYKS